ncbi:MAG TPA: Fur family transcriptional regulator [Dongiaceae bacterium]|jgi:Fur family iron response transcriptional regulator|nr:Fur family transcriptional regulator [Dongiaceae bacterium]
MTEAKQTEQRPFTPIVQRLRAAGLRPTSQRLYLARLLFEQGDRHVTAEQLHSEAQSARIAVSLATVYNTLHQFTAAGLMRELVIESGRSYFDTNVTNHHHFFFEENGALVDIPGENLALASVPPPPDGTRISRVDVVVRVTRGK